MNNQYGPHKSTIGDMDANLMAVIAYCIAIVISFVPYIGHIAWIAPLVIFFIEKNSTFVKYHAMQAFVLGVLAGILKLILAIIFLIVRVVVTGAGMLNNPFAAISGIGIIALLSRIVAIVINLALIGLEVFVIMKAYKYIKFEIPLIEKLVNFMIIKLDKKTK